MEFEWDEQKRQLNLRKHGIDFDRAREMWRGNVLELPSPRETGEDRHLATGLVGEQMVTAVYTWRGHRRRLISVRRARRHEREDYQEAFGRGRQ